VTFLDDDDVLTPDRLDVALAGLQRASVALCLVAFMGRTGKGSPRILEGDMSKTILDGLTPNVGAAAIERSVVPLFDERFRALQDVEWWLRLAQAQRFATEPEVCYLFRIHDGVRHGNGMEARIGFRLRLLDKHSEYFRNHPRALAFQWKRLGLNASTLGAQGVARRAFLITLRIRLDASSFWHLARAMRPSTMSASDLGVSTRSAGRRRGLTLIASSGALDPQERSTAGSVSST
jgi:hypothetical protein